MDLHRHGGGYHDVIRIKCFVNRKLGSACSGTPYLAKYSDCESCIEQYLRILHTVSHFHSYYCSNSPRKGSTVATVLMRKAELSQHLSGSRASQTRMNNSTQ